MKKKTKIILAVIILLLIPIMNGLDFSLLIRRYTVDTDKLDSTVRIALITDLHSCRYGNEQQELIEAVDSQNPDLVMLVGDIFDDKLSDINTEVFLEDVSAKYPCFYVSGNHEFWSGSAAFDEKMAIIERYGIKRLSGELEKIEVNGQTVAVCGVDDPAVSRLASDDNTVTFSEQLERVRELAQSGEFTVLLSHRPEYFELYMQGGFDLVLCGHAHGGQWRIPYILNGLYAPNQGLFPKYAGGEYFSEDAEMIVSRGLARESTVVPRFYNRPELVIVDCG